MTTIRLDYESFGEESLPDVGLDRYARPDKTYVHMLSYQIDNNPLVQIEDSGASIKRAIPGEFREAMLDPAVIKKAFNAQFERVMTRRILGIQTPTRGWRCTMALGFMGAFTGGLGDMARALGLPADKSKDTEGKKLIRLFCQPQKVTGNRPFRIRDGHTDPDLWSEFLAYNRQDVVAERELERKLQVVQPGPLEWRAYEMDQQINDRGMPVDVEFARRAYAMYCRFREQGWKEMVKLSGIDNPNSPVQLLAWLRAEGYWFNDLRKETIEKVLGEVRGTNLLPLDELLDAEEEAGNDWLRALEGQAITIRAVRLLLLRQWVSKTSTEKYPALIEQAQLDGVSRFMFQYGGASRTLRWAGRGAQPQNLPRTPKFMEEIDVQEMLMKIVDAEDDEDMVFTVKQPADAIVGLIRATFHAPENATFETCDLSAIESRVIGWISECKRLQKVFADKKDPYKDFGVEFYGKPYEDITKAERNICKPPTLGCGYRLGGGELREGKRTGLWGYAENMGVNMTREQSHKAVKLWRETYPEIPALWKTYEAAVRKVLKGIEQKVKCGPVTFEKIADFLTIKLPSGRRLWYHKPRLEMRKVMTGRMVRQRVDGVIKEVEDSFESEAFTYMGQHQKTRQWIRLENHGGRFVEQVTQAIARDVLLEGMFRAKKAGFRIVGHVHDEIITLLTDQSQPHKVALLRELMIEPIPWAPGLLLDAEGWSGEFYRK